MATAISRLLEEMPERLPVCEVCQEDFQSPQRLPRVLPCHHAVCGDCLQQLCKDNHFNCPLCHRSVVPHGPFPVETTRMTLLDLKKIIEGQEDRHCEGCSKKAMVTARCLECKESLCEVCCRAHKKVKATKNHCLVSLAEAAIDPSKLLQLTEKCDKHEEKKLEFYCPECRQPACSSCAVLIHSGHNMDELQDVMENKRKKLQAECQKLKEAIPHFKGRVKSSTANLKKMDDRRSEISDEVKELFSRAMQLLDEREEQILADFEAKIKEERKALEDQQASDESLLSEARASLEFRQRMACLGSPSQLLSAPQEMTRTCDDLEQQQGTVAALPVSLYEMDSSKMSELNDLVMVTGDIIGNPEWFFGNISQEDAERELMAPGRTNGVFLVRSTGSDPGTFVLCVRGCDAQNESQVFNYKIKRDGGYYVDPDEKYDTLSHLVTHYSTDADGLCCKLTDACPKLRPQEHFHELEVPRGSIKLSTKLFDCSSGKVWKGKLHEGVDVAVKTLKPGSMSLEAFLAEAKMLLQLRHQKVVQLMAVCTTSEPVCIMTELCVNGNLEDFLREDKGKAVTFTIMIEMASQIAEGMAYLETQDVVHRNLRAANILVGDNHELKVAGFGMAQVLPEGGIYEAPESATFPVKWTAPEAALERKFSIKSDVWSFGVLLYEIITFGLVPYPGMGQREVVELIALPKAYRMPKPDGRIACPDSYYDIMLKCWAGKPEERPTFDYLHSVFDDFFIATEPTHQII